MKLLQYEVEENNNSSYQMILQEMYKETVEDQHNLIYVFKIRYLIHKYMSNNKAKVFIYFKYSG